MKKHIIGIIKKRVFLRFNSKKTFAETIFMNSLNILVMLIGALLIVNAVGIVFSSKYYSFFSRVYFIEPGSESGKERAKKVIHGQEYIAQRYGLSIVSIALGLVIVSWSVGTLKSIPFFVLAVVAFFIAFVIKFIKR